MTIAQMIIETARAQGLRHTFGLPGGGALLDVLEAGHARGVEFVSVAHESSAAVAAAAYGAALGTAGLAVAIRGPGAANLAAGAAYAYFERKPVVCLSESFPDSVTQREMTQKCDHALLFGAVAKRHFRLKEKDAAASVSEAFAIARDGRPGPVSVDLPSDVASRQSQTAPPAPSRAAPKPAATSSVAEAIRHVSAFRRPVLIVGGDVLREGIAAESVRDSLVRLAADLGAAVLVEMDARGAYPESDPRYAGVYTGVPNPRTLGNRLLDGADGVVLVGVDSLMTEAPWTRTLPTCELLPDARYESLTPRPVARLDGPVVASAQALVAGIETGGSGREGYPVQAIRDLKASVELDFARPRGAALAAQDIIEIGRELLPDQGWLFSETGIFVLMLEQLWRVSGAETFFGTSGGRTMGLMLPAILGAKLARPEVPMLGIGGDGSLLMRLGELEAFARMRVAVPLVIANDGALGTIKSRQKSRGLPAYSLGLARVDFAAVARGCGLEGVTVTTPEELRRALARAFQAPTATLIDARVDPQPYQDSFGPTTGAAPAV